MHENIVQYNTCNIYRCHNTSEMAINLITYRRLPPFDQIVIWPFPTVGYVFKFKSNIVIYILHYIR